MTDAQDEGEWRRSAEQGAEPNVSGMTKERIAHSKRDRAGSLAIVEQPQQVARTCILQPDVMLSFSGVTLICFASFRLFVFTEAAALRPIVLRYACTPTDTCSYLATVCVFFLFFFYRDVAFSEYFAKLQFLYVWRVRHGFFPSGWLFLPCELRLDFWHELIM